MMGIFSWIVPPFAGALIGYLTNFIAVKMLFRPLNEYRVLGMRIPFTPGIIPRNRKKLALAIAEMTESELLSPEIIRERCQAPDFRAAVERSVCCIIENCINRYAAHFEDKAFTEAGIKNENAFSFFINSAESVRNAAFKIMLESIKSQVMSKKNIDTITASIIDEIPDLTGSLNIKTTVRQRIDSMEVIKVERIVLDVMADKLVWINIFGAILGALIGIFQAVLVKFLL